MMARWIRQGTLSRRCRTRAFDSYKSRMKTWDWLRASISVSGSLGVAMWLGWTAMMWPILSALLGRYSILSSTWRLIYLVPVPSFLREREKWWVFIRRRAIMRRFVGVLGGVFPLLIQPGWEGGRGLCPIRIGNGVYDVKTKNSFCVVFPRASLPRWRRCCLVIGWTTSQPGKPDKGD